MTQEQFSEAGAALVADPELAVRLGARVLPYQQAAPALLGMLAFGSQWESLLPSSSGVQVQLPVQDSPERKNVNFLSITPSRSWHTSENNESFLERDLGRR